MITLSWDLSRYVPEFVFSEYDTHGEPGLSGISGPYKVELDWDAQEGWNGDYDTTDPEDQKLLRFHVYRLDPEVPRLESINHPDPWIWEAIDSASYCTRLPTSAPLEIRKKFVTSLLMAANDGAGKRDWEWFSWYDGSN